MSKPNLLAIWAKHERGEGATNEELGHLIERFESMQDGLEQAEREAKAAKGVITQHITERSLETHRNVGIAVDEAVKAVVQLLIEDPSRRAREAEAAVARVRDLGEAWHVDSFVYDSNALNGTLTINVSDAAKHVACALDGEQK